MSKTRYTLGNDSSETYELSDTHIGWIPEGCADWQAYHAKNTLLDFTNSTHELTLVNQVNNERVTLLLYQYLIKDAFHTSQIFQDSRFNEWFNFGIVSTKDLPDEKFIIPLH